MELVMYSMYVRLLHDILSVTWVSNFVNRNFLKDPSTVVKTQLYTKVIVLYAIRYTSAYVFWLLHTKNKRTEHTLNYISKQMIHRKAFRYNRLYEFVYLHM